MIVVNCLLILYMYDENQYKKYIQDWKPGSFPRHRAIANCPQTCYCLLQNLLEKNTVQNRMIAARQARHGHMEPRGNCLVCFYTIIN